MCCNTMIQVDISNIWGEVSLPDLLALEKEIFDAHNTLTEGTGAGSGYRGWLDLPVVRQAVTINGLISSTLSTTLSTGTSLPMSTTVYPADLSITPAMFFPMSCGSPSAECMTTFPLVFLSPEICFSAMDTPISMDLAAIITSGRWHIPRA